MKNEAISRFCIFECASIAMSSSSLFSSNADADPSLEDLIDSVSIGKTAIDNVSGKCKLTGDTTLQECSPSCFNGGNFDPLTLPLQIETAFSDSTLKNTSDSHKRQKQCTKNGTVQFFSNEQKSAEPQTFSKEQSIADAIKYPTISGGQDISNVNVTQRSKRKRRLLYDESSCLGGGQNEKNGCDESQVVHAVVASENVAVLSEPYSHEEEQSSETLTSSKEYTCSFDDTTTPCSSDALPGEPDCSLQVCTAVGSISPSGNEETPTLANGLSGIPDLQHLSLHEKTALTQYEITDLIASDSSMSSQASMDTETEEQACTAVLSKPDADHPTAGDVKKVDRTRKKRKSSSEAESRSLRKRIRKTLPPVKTRQTPLGLPKPLRLKKQSFSIEEIYTNKNYSTPVPKLLETIFEYPKEEKDGTVRYSDKKRKERAVYFCTNPADRPVKKRAKKKFKKRPTRRNDKDIEADTKLIDALALLDQQLQINDLSP